jgi:hypothetical protein
MERDELREALKTAYSAYESRYGSSKALRVIAIFCNEAERDCDGCNDTESAHDYAVMNTELRRLAERVEDD